MFSFPDVDGFLAKEWYAATSCTDTPCFYGVCPNGAMVGVIDNYGSHSLWYVRVDVFGRKTILRRDFMYKGAAVDVCQAFIGGNAYAPMLLID